MSIPPGRVTMRIIRAVAVVAMVTLGANSAYPEDVNLRKVPTRLLSVPNTVSPAMQKAIGSFPAQHPEYPEPFRTTEEWAEFFRPSPQLLAAIGRLRDQYGVSVAPEMINGVRCYRVTPKARPARNRHRLLVNLHQGGFGGGSGEAGLNEAIVMAGIAGYEVLEIDYRLIPNHAFPAAMDDIMAVWKSVVKSIPVENVGIFGSSAGGGLVLSLVQRAKRENLPLPAAISSGTPWSDLSKTGDTYYTNDGVDYLTYNATFGAMAKLYAGGRNLKDPLVSPVYGDFTGFPPTFLISGTRDLFLSNTVRVHRELLRARVPSELIVAEGEPHGGYLAAAFVNAPEVNELYTYIAEFFDEHLGH